MEGMRERESRSKPSLASVHRRPNLKDTVADYLRDLIFSGELRPGDKVDQDAVAGELGVSKLPVREALIALESEALIENIARRGSYVAHLSPEDIRDHYRIYGLISAVAARRAAEALTDEQLHELEEIVEEMARLANAHDDDASVGMAEEDLNFQFHRMINLAGGTRRLLSVLHLLSQGIPSRFYEFTTGWTRTAVDHHRKILEAFTHRDGEEAAQLMADHLEASGEHAVRMLKTAGFWAAKDSRHDSSESG